MNLVGILRLFLGFYFFLFKQTRTVCCVNILCYCSLCLEFQVLDEDETIEGSTGNILSE